ncbi:MAG: DUF5337 domain-containing protein [Brevirhabdus sp.]
MTDNKVPESELARRAKRIAILLAVVMAAWMGAQVLGGTMGLEPRFAFLVDFAALAAFAWALVNIYWIWRARRANKG